MIKINYKNPEEHETSEDIARANIIISDKFKKGDYLVMSCTSWLKLDPKRDYQDLEQLLRYLDLDSHVIASPIKTIPENLEINHPNGSIPSEPFEYVIKIACRPKEEAIKELLLTHPNYEENFDCLKKTGCLMVKKTNLDNCDETNENNKTDKTNSDDNEIKKVLNCELKLDFAFYKPMESINFIIGDLIKQYGTEPEQVICGEINGNKVYALMIKGQICSPIGWIKKQSNEKVIELDENDKDLNMTIELIDFRTIKLEKN